MKIPYRYSPLVFLGCVFVVLALTFPWVETFSTGFIRHWDPPFHAWKLEFVAKSIMSGHLLPLLNTNTNMYYPHSGALFYEALHWPQALFAAGLFCFTDNPVLVYHVTLITFWALSGVCIWMMLLALKATNLAALFGAFVFVALPYRISYIVEFNMQLNFALPLFFFFVIRFFQRPHVGYACGIALALWLQASSELYQAVFLMFLMPFFALGFCGKIFETLKNDKKIWLYFVAAIVLFGVLTYCFLSPYYTLLSSNTLTRKISEIVKHSVEPFTYFRPEQKYSFISSPNVKNAEMTIYHTLTLIVLSVVSLAYGYYKEFSANRTKMGMITSSLTVLLLIAFGGLSVFYYNTSFSGKFLMKFYSCLPQLTIIVLIMYLLSVKSRNITEMFVRSLFAGSVFSFFMTLGPFISIRNSDFSAENRLYLFLYKHIDALHGFRVVSRFDIFIIIFMIVITVLLLSKVQLLLKQHRAWLSCPLYLVPMALIAYECIPRAKALDIHPVDNFAKSPVLVRLDEIGEMEGGITPYVLAVLPMGNRNVDSRHMLQIARNKRLFVYAWGGTYPTLTRDICKSADGTVGDPAKTVSLLRQLWPECYILEDIQSTVEDKRLSTRFKELYAGLTTIVEEDDRFVLMQLNKDIEPEKEKIRLVRQDFVEKYKTVVFSASLPESSVAYGSGLPPSQGLPPAISASDTTSDKLSEPTLSLFLNDTFLGEWVLSSKPVEYTVEIPPKASIPIEPNVFRFVLSEGGFVLDGFRLM